ncbi:MULTISPECIES: RNA polymerase sigma factor [Nonlabens]|uniref:RNA polymerase ECF-type sigma factor n=1 Tax=Nonlabens ulvanivorans TaxID=906888 RepID=A0A090QFL1_NONUL|nr:sigma-70 family RNA polymerase sigma factor [Nonlabens ulvanivorans]PRX12138.1 RNA polymerase sigma-70 factor (ECF subfamily) [Nonlabens ulvanivorans]GAL01920.1 RNA polymerase ECF-type sigma factor [Nonlabens ulvanivorans]
MKKAASLRRNTNQVTLTETEISVYDLCEQGDQRAQMKVYDSYSRGMYHVALRILKDSGEAEDVMQESMIAAFHKMSQWNREATFGSWLKRIVINNSLSRLRKTKKMETVSYDDVAYHLESQADDQQIDMENAGMTAKKVLLVMNKLKDNYKQILTLHLIEGMDNEEICEIMKISNAMCRTTISRAKESLRTKIKAHE